MKKLFTIVVLSMSVVGFNSLAQAKQTGVSLSDKEFACEGLAGHQVELEHSLGYAVKQEFKDEKVLVDFGGNMAYMTPQQSVSYYNERIRHVKSLAKILGCHPAESEANHFGTPKQVSMLK